MHAVDADEQYMPDGVIVAVSASRVDGSCERKRTGSDGGKQIFHGI
jgi:hypothetical protein